MKVCLENIRVVTRFLHLGLLLLFISCGRSGIEEQQLKSLDSLNGALSIKLKELQGIDTGLMNRALKKFDHYRQFIKQNVNDTLEKEEADKLQRFYSCGKNLQDFKENRRTILGRGELVSGQIGKLIQDIRKDVVPVEETNIYLVAEKMSAEQLIKATFGQQQTFVSAIEAYKLSIEGVEQVIRKRNNGELPVIIKDSIPF